MQSKYGLIGANAQGEKKATEFHSEIDEKLRSFIFRFIEKYLKSYVSIMKAFLRL